MKKQTSFLKLKVKYENLFVFFACIFCNPRGEVNQLENPYWKTVFTYDEKDPDFNDAGIRSNYCIGTDIDGVSHE